MKTLLIATDFSANARHVATYGYHLAKQLRANIVLCHALNVPSECLQTGTVPWPAEVYNDLVQDSEKALAQLKRRLSADVGSQDYQPDIVCTQEAGFVKDVLNTVAETYKADMILIGMHSKDALSTFMLGNHTRRMIEASVRPLLLVPQVWTARPVKKIGLCLDLNQDKDGHLIKELVAFAKLLDAEVVLTHVDPKVNAPDHGLRATELIENLSSELDYKKISFKVVANDNIEDGISWFTRNEHIDILAMIRHEHSFLNEVIKGSNTKRTARQLSVPLFILKSNS